MNIDLRQFSRALAEGCEKGTEFHDIFAGSVDDGRYLVERGEAKMIRRSSIAVLQGQPKTGKSTVAMAITMAALRGAYAGFKAAESGLVVLWIDTEQGGAELDMRCKRALDVIDMCTPEKAARLKVVLLKTEPVAERLGIVRRAVKDAAADLVVIDGIADLVKDFNKSDECADMAEALGDIAERYGVAIIGIIHENKGDGNAKGHAGSQISQKCYEDYSVSKNGDTVNVAYRFGRGADVPSFSLKFGEGGVPIPAELGKEESEKEKQWRTWREAVTKYLPESKDGYAGGQLIDAYMKHTGKGKTQANADLKTAEGFGAVVKLKRGRYLLPFSEFEATDQTDQTEEIF